MNDDQVKGRADQMKGNIKEKTGQGIGNRALFGDAKEKVKDAIDKI